MHLARLVKCAKEVTEAYSAAKQVGKYKEERRQDSVIPRWKASPN
jgi:hypothetical protein